jgi:phosphate transport system substrate-binding protein
MTSESERLSGLVSRRKFLVSSGAVGATALAGCTSGGDGDSTTEDSEGSGSETLSGEVVNTGSSTVYPVTNAMAERFMEEHS